jgi:hypothetical protein
MITPMIISALLLTLIAAAVLYDAIRHASVGYQDEYGFHAGSDAQLGACNPHGAIISVKRSTRSSSKKARAKSRKATTETVSVQQGSSLTYQI